MGAIREVRSGAVMVLVGAMALWAQHQIIVEHKAIAARHGLVQSDALDSLKSHLKCRGQRPLLAGAAQCSEQARALGLHRLEVLHFDDSLELDSIVGSCQQSGLFDHVEVDVRLHPLLQHAVVPDDRYFPFQWALNNDGSYSAEDAIIARAGADVGMSRAWGIEQGDSSIIVALIDGGIASAHREFAGRLWKNPDEIDGNGVDDDGNGYVDDMVGWDFAGRDNIPEDTLGHGTATASLLAANGNNHVGISGVDWQCKLMILKTFGSAEDGANASDLASAIIYAANKGARVVNMSLGTLSDVRAVRNAIRYAADKGVILVAASGNTNAPVIEFPARYSQVIAVGSTNPDDTRSAPFMSNDATRGSAYGAELELVGPGNYIYFASHRDDTLVNIGAGTSLSAPLVSGAASLLLAQDPLRSAQDVRSILTATAADTVGLASEDTPGWDRYYGYGRLDIFAALQLHNPVVAAPSYAVPHQEPLSVGVQRHGAGVVLTLRSGGTVQGVSATLYDGRGRRVAGDTFEQLHRSAQLNVPRELPPGMYVLSVNGPTLRHHATLLLP